MHAKRTDASRWGASSRSASGRLTASAALLALSIWILGLELKPASAAVAGGLSEIPPELLQRARDMSPDQQRRLAEQYGVDLDSLLGADGGRTLDDVGRPGERINPASSYRDPRFTEEVARDESKENDESKTEQEADSIKVRSLEPSERYGVDFFTAAVSSFEPVDNAPVPADYRLGPGDSLNLLMIGKDNEEFEAVVDRDGSITFPQLGRIPLAGMTFEEASTLVGARVAAQLIGVDVLVGMGRLRAINVTLAGEVRVPGSRSMSSLARVTHALFAAGV